MMHQDDFFTPEDVDRQIDQVGQLQKGEHTDAEALAYLRSYYRTNSAQEREMLGRIWNRVAQAIPFEQNRIVTQDQLTPGTTAGREPPRRPRRTSFMQRLGMLAAAVFLVALIGSMALVFYAIRHNTGNTGSGSPTAVPTTVPTTAPAPFKVTSVDMSVTPTSIAGMACGTNVTVTYTATFHIAPDSAGGTIQFGYTINNGRGNRPASLPIAAGETTKTYSFTWSGALPADRTYPEPGGVSVTSPNAITSQLVGPTGACTPAAFRVTSVDMSVSPASISGIACGTNVTVTYTAAIQVAPGSAGGTVLFLYTTNNGRGQNPASLTFGPGETTKTFSFTWSGALSADNTAPGQGGIQVTSPNVLASRSVKPAGTCQ